MRLHEKQGAEKQLKEGIGNRELGTLLYRVLKGACHA